MVRSTGSTGSTVESSASALLSLFQVFWPPAQVEIVQPVSSIWCCVPASGLSSIPWIPSTSSPYDRPVSPVAPVPPRGSVQGRQVRLRQRQVDRVDHPPAAGGVHLLHREVGLRVELEAGEHVIGLH